MTPSLSRATGEPTTLVMPKTLAPLIRASRIAARVSAVSPDCDTATTSVLGVMMGLRYLNSLAASTAHGMRAQPSMRFFAMRPAW